MTPRIHAPVLMLAALTACQSSAAPAPSATAPTPQASVASPAPADAQQALDRLDTRTPVPLVPMMANHQKQNMRDHLAAVQEIVAAVAVKDFTTAEKAAGRIGYSDQMGMMCTHMGAGAPAFTEAALNFHHTADRIADAAKEKDAQGVLTALGQTLATCTSCHATFKQKTVTDQEWTAITRAAPPDHPVHGP